MPNYDQWDLVVSEPPLRYSDGYRHLRTGDDNFTACGKQRILNRVWCDDIDVIPQCPDCLRAEQLIESATDGAFS